MNTFDRHLLGEWLKILGLVLLATLGLLLMQVMYDDLVRLRELGARGLDLWTYFVVTLPSFFALVLPFVLLVSLLFSLGQLHRANEFTAMRAAGVGFFRLTRPLWLVGLACCGLTWWLNASVVPWSVGARNALDQGFQFRAQSQLAADRRGASIAVAFDNPVANRIWFMNRYSRFTGTGYGVTVSLLDSARHETQRIVAALGRRDPGDGWQFQNGYVLRFDPVSGEASPPKLFAELRESAFSEDPSLMLLIGQRPVDLSFFELARLRNYFDAYDPARAIPYAVRYFGLLADTFSPLIVIAIAIPFAMAGVRVNPAVGVSKSIGLFCLYYVLSTVAGTLAAKAWLSPEAAAWLPNAGLAALAAWFFSRLR